MSDSPDTTPCTPADTATDLYTGGYSAHLLQGFARRSAAREAAFFLPHLRAGMKLLDCGCGPGALSVDLAQVVAPGDVVGIDIEESQFELARQRAAERGVGNVMFQRASLYELPFPNASFDAVFAHAVLYHLREPVRALAEIRRVLKHGGVVGVRDADSGGDFWHPVNPDLERTLALSADVMRHHGGNPCFGRLQRAALREAGFGSILVSASYDYYGNDGQAPRFADYWADHFLVEHRALVLKEGWTPADELDAMRAAVREWGRHSDAFFARCRCEAVGFNPP